MSGGNAQVAVAAVGKDGACEWIGLPKSENRLGASISDMYTFVYIYFWPRSFLSKELVGLVELDPLYDLHIRQPFLVPV